MQLWAVSVRSREGNSRVEAAAVRIHLLLVCAGAGDTDREVKGSLQNVRPLLCVCPFAKTDFVLGKAVSSWCWRNLSSVVQLLWEIPLALVFSPDSPASLRSCF